MKILLLDDEKFFFQLLQVRLSKSEIFYESNPIEWLEKIAEEKINLNDYQFIFCDFNFNNIDKNAFDLKLSEKIRGLGFVNYLILFSMINFFNAEELKKTEYFDLIVDKNNLEDLSVLENKCLNNKHKYY